MEKESKVGGSTRSREETTPRLARRACLHRLTQLFLGGWLGQKALRGEPAPWPNPVGYATISWPESEFQQALETISSLGFKGVQMLGWVREAYAGPQAGQLKSTLQRLRLRPAALSASGVRLDPARNNDETENFRRYAAFLKTLGGRFLQVTDGGRPRGEYSTDQIRSLGRRMDALGKIAQEMGLELGYHPHFGTLGETREGLGRVLEATDPRYVRLIADVAHLTLGGSDPAEVIRTYHSRLLFTHFKDVPRHTLSLARQNRDLVRGEKYRFCEIGRGAVNFPAILQAFRDVKFKGWVIIELDAYRLPPGGAAESARVNRDAIAKMGFRV